MKIKRLQTFILHVPVTKSLIGDSTHKVTKWGMPGVIIEAEDGTKGYGYTGTHADITIDRAIISLIDGLFAPLLIDEDAEQVHYLNDKMMKYPQNIWVGRGGLLQLAISAIDIALWDLKAKLEGNPLWKSLGGTTKRKISAYNTDCGWLVRSVDELIDDCKKAVLEDGFSSVKLKVGKPDPKEDLYRVEKVRAALGDQVTIMVDANAKWDLATAKQYGSKFADYNIRWFEEPMWHNDVKSHQILAEHITTPIALGELLYTIDEFRDFMINSAVDYIMPDATRCGGLTGVWNVAELGKALHIPVTPHHGDMMQAQLHLCMAHTSCNLLEYIPWTLHCFEEPVKVTDGYYELPSAPGAGTTLTKQALENYSVK